MKKRKVGRVTGFVEHEAHHTFFNFKADNWPKNFNQPAKRKKGSPK